MDVRADPPAPRSPVAGRRRALKYLAPGKFTIKTPKGREQAFGVDDNTKITGHGKICGEGQSCTAEQLESSTKSGVGATVVMKNGVATSIVETN
ncbi:hypothetical protein OG533_21285 [Streptomyces sp. NBC_01186]|uniref:hypothetical protein n=1 Tax=Streptomyces sp. NBC_01186 TaxID=2903765 RepID=UPI002E0E487D|nr:hypothetical protein OG533_21285 [Streptomyces sp. NBC_01186]